MRESNPAEPASASQGSHRTCKRPRVDWNLISCARTWALILFLTLSLRNVKVSLHKKNSYMFVLFLNSLIWRKTKAIQTFVLKTVTSRGGVQPVGPDRSEWTRFFKPTSLSRFQSRFFSDSLSNFSSSRSYCVLSWGNGSAVLVCLWRVWTRRRRQVPAGVRPPEGACRFVSLASSQTSWLEHLLSLEAARHLVCHRLSPRLLFHHWLASDAISRSAARDEQPCMSVPARLTRWECLA